MAKQVMLFDFHNMAFKNFQLEVANTKPLLAQSLTLHKYKFLVRKAYFLQLQNFVSLATAQGMYVLFAVSKNIIMKFALNTST